MLLTFKRTTFNHEAQVSHRWLEELQVAEAFLPGVSPALRRRGFQMLLFPWGGCDFYSVRSRLENVMFPLSNEQPSWKNNICTFLNPHKKGSKWINPQEQKKIARDAAKGKCETAGKGTPPGDKHVPVQISAEDERRQKSDAFPNTWTCERATV